MTELLFLIELLGYILQKCYIGLYNLINHSRYLSVLRVTALKQ